MKIKLVLLSLLAFGFIFNSCKDDTDTPLSRKEMLTAKAWIITSKTIDPPFSMGGIMVSDVTIMDSDTVKNYSYKFNTDGTLMVYRKSNQLVSQTAWTFNADETKITINPGIVYTYPVVGNISLTDLTIDKITADQIDSTNPYSFGGINYTIKVVFKPK